MNKDRITIVYILLTLTILVVASIYIYKIDLKESNAQIGQKAERVYGSGKEYSQKIYSMVSAYSNDVEHYFSEKNVTGVKEITTPKKIKIRTKTTIKTKSVPKIQTNTPKLIESNLSKLNDVISIEKNDLHNTNKTVNKLKLKITTKKDNK